MQQQQQQIHADGSLRHAEKRRIGTCQFANRIARISLDAYESCVPQSYRDCHKQTCVAAIVAHYNNQNDDSNADNDDGATSGATTLSNRTHSNLQVMGLGVGTKFLPDAAIREEEQQNQNANTTTYSDNGNISSLETQYGTRIRDCHAEVLARRAFRRQLALEIMDDLKKNDNNEKESAAETTTTNNNNNDDGKHGYLPILERIECNVGNSTNDGDSTECSVTNNKFRYRLRQDVTLHFYASSAPCGNATLKKFIKMEKEKFDTSLGPDEWPTQKHVPIAAHSLRLGQFALLVKKDGSLPTDNNSDEHSSSNATIVASATTSETLSSFKSISIVKKESDQITTTSNVDNVEITQQNLSTPNNNKNKHSKKQSKKSWPCTENDTWCPPSCSITNYNKGTIHSCSDKLCRWNCLGLQGSLLMPMLEAPLYMATLTVGRKFSRAICQRAVCCRAEGFRSKIGGTTGSELDENGSSVETHGEFRLNHPALMETCVYMDESGTHKMEGVKTIGQDASFDSNLCWVWWPGKAAECGGDNAADCIDGKVGFATTYGDSGVEDDADVEEQETKVTPMSTAIISRISTVALMNFNMEILAKCSSNILEENDVPPAASLTLAGMRLLKRQVSSQYERAKDDLFRHRIFRQWSCRDCRSK